MVKATSLTGWQVACLRSLVAAVTLVLFMPGARRGWTPRALLVGGAYAGALVGFVLASKLTTAANAVFLAGTAPLYIALLAPLLLGERLRVRDLSYMGLMAIGMVLCLTDAEAHFETAPDPVTGNILAVVTGLFWALTVLGLRWLGREEASSDDAAAAVVSGNIMAFLFCLPAATPFPILEPIDVGIVLYLGAVQIGLAYILLTRAMQQVPALEASLLLLVEPVLSSLLAWAVHGEVQGRWAMTGAVLILSATLLRAGLGLRRGSP